MGLGGLCTEQLFRDIYALPVCKLVELLATRAMRDGLN